jgi:ferritin-like metal-binding protein YciE
MKIIKFNKNGRIIENGSPSSQQMELFVEQLNDIFWAEKELIKAIPKMISLAKSVDLIIAMTDHMSETIEQVRRLSKVYIRIDKKPVTVICDTMESLISEAIEIQSNCVNGSNCDVGIISAVKKLNTMK